ncbi:hemicentin-1-like [Anticarsia gemmatalis]|uniref:hemicentin-1-like n=1 Tax=Anticarsia gemmatalis TaxID=129554 RepID=UPI003F76C7BC
MLFKYIIILYFLWFSKLVCCDKSFTLVVDTTVSMQEELDIIKVNLASAIDVYGHAGLSDYIIVPFNDPGVSETVVTLTPRDLISAINRLTVSGGRECPENSLAGIERALLLSKPGSNIFLFTDAYSKDFDKLTAIENLCKNTKSQVVIFLTGFCLPSPPTINAQVYYDVAKACSGTVFRLDTPDLRQVFKYIKEVINVDWTEVISYDTFTNQKQLSISVDSFTKTILLAVSGEYPTVELSPVLNSSSSFEHIVESRHTQVLRLEASPGEYKVAIRCGGTTSAILYKKRQLPLQIGFSSVQPRNIRETSRRPMPGRTNYMLIEVSENFQLESIEIEVYNEPKKALELETLSTDVYLTNTFVEPDKSFRLWIEGTDKASYEKIGGTTESFVPQMTVIDTRWVRPKAEILEGTSLTVEYGHNATLACKVLGYPKPTVSWEDDNGGTDTSEGVLLEIPSTYITYYHIDSVTTSFSVHCKCRNAEGEDSQSIDIIVHRPYVFQVLQTPEDQSIEYDTEGKLFCQVSAYPEAEVKWYHNDSLVTTDNTEIAIEESALVIKRMSLNNVGEYRCEVSNEVNSTSYTATVAISGLEEPQLKVENTNIVLRHGDWSVIECSVSKGKPSPEITWQFRSEGSEDFGSLPDSVLVEDSKLKISSAQTEHNGVYRCLADNIQGQDYVDITVTVQSPPAILYSESTTVVVKEDDDVALPCNVTASPTAAVRWEMSQDDVIIHLDHRHYTDEHNTHRFKALWRDSGNYHCIAENNIGKAEITITVNVLVKPFIEPRPKTMTVRAGADVTLYCNVNYGNPVPTTKWEFTAVDSTTRILKRSNSSSYLYVPKVRYSDEGSYICIAVNDVGRDSIEIFLKVQ